LPLINSTLPSTETDIPECYVLRIVVKILKEKKVSIQMIDAKNGRVWDEPNIKSDNLPKRGPYYRTETLCLLETFP